jgi:hypothetical protein
MKMLWRQQEVAGLGLLERVGEHAARFGVWMAYSLPWAWGSNLGIAFALAAVWLGLFIAATIYVVRGPVEVRRAMAEALSAVAYPLLHVAAAGTVYAAYFADTQCWYLALPYLEMYLAIVILGGTLWQAAVADDRLKRWSSRVLVVAAVFTVVGLVRYGLTLEKGFWAWQRDVYAGIEPVDRLTPPGARIGCFNAGIPGYYSHRRIINLDGLVNNAIVPYWRTKTFNRYLVDAHISAIYDENLSLSRAKQFSGAFPNLAIVSQHPLTNCIVDTRYLWTLKPVDRRPKKPSP